MKKRPFILLEILIACTLLTLFISPLMKKPIELYQTEMNALREVEKQRLADLAFADLKESLLKNQIPWKKLPTKKTSPKVYTLPPAIVQIPYCDPKPIQKKAIIHCKREKTGIKGEIYSLLEIEIVFEPFKKDPKKPPCPRYIYRTLIKKLNDS